MTHTQPLPDFSGEATKCAACGHNRAGTEYRATGVCVHDIDEQARDFTPNPRLHRTCDRCGFQWDEATLDPTKASTGPSHTEPAESCAETTRSDRGHHGCIRPARHRGIHADGNGYVWPEREAMDSSFGRRPENQP